MSATPVKIGPFVGGLNTYSAPAAIADNELVDMLNFDIDLDGSLFSRPPFRKTDTEAELPGSGAFILLGWFHSTTGTNYLIGSSSSGTYARNETTGLWSTITTTFGATCMVQYANKAWLVSDPADTDPGGYWDVSGFVADSDIPHGTSAVVYKERLFVAGSTTQPNRIYFSDVANFGVWQKSINFFDARSGDGQDIIKLMTFQDTILIFKENCTYAFAYDSAPTRGAVRLVNGAIGATNRFCVVEYDNSLYIHYIDKVFQMQNWNFTQINVKVPFVATAKYGGLATRESSLSVINDRLLVHHTDNIYVFNLRNATWTIWDIPNITFNFNFFLRVPQRISTDVEKYYAGSRLNNNRSIIEWQPDYPVGTWETMNCYIVTKVYDFNVPYSFKRMFWWGIDMLNKANLTYTVYPVRYVENATHKQLHRFTHDELRAGTHLQPLSEAVTYVAVTTHNDMAAYTHDELHAGTHLSPLGEYHDPTINENIKIDNVAENRMFIKLLKGLRFRQIYFTIGGTNNGSLSQAPFRIYSLTAFIDDKQGVVKKVN